jgi:hypothetical protein
MDNVNEPGQEHPQFAWEGNIYGWSQARTCGLIKEATFRSVETNEI